MKHNQMLGLINAIFEQVEMIHTEGQKEYAMDEDNVFANFERIANQTGIHRERVLWVYFMKHVDGIASYLKGHRSQREEVQGRLTDAIVYLCILWGMIENPLPAKSINEEDAITKARLKLEKESGFGIPEERSINENKVQ